MWGFYNSRDFFMANSIFDLILNVNMAKKCSMRKCKNKYNGDQNFLKQYVYPKIKRRSTVHDSFKCALYGGEPFPTKRKGDCFVGKNGKVLEIIQKIYSHIKIYI